MAAKPDETRDGVDLTNLDQPLFDGAEATKRDLVDYLDGVADRFLPVLRDRPLSVVRAHRMRQADAGGSKAMGMGRPGIAASGSRALFSGVNSGTVHEGHERAGSPITSL